MGWLLMLSQFMVIWTNSLISPCQLTHGADQGLPPSASVRLHPPEPDFIFLWQHPLCGLSPGHYQNAPAPPCHRSRRRSELDLDLDSTKLTDFCLPSIFQSQRQQNLFHALPIMHHGSMSEFFHFSSFLETSFLLEIYVCRSAFYGHILCMYLSYTHVRYRTQLPPSCAT